MKIVAILFLLFLAAPAAAAPQSGAPQALGQHGFWRAYRTNENGQPVCYMTLTARFPKNKKLPRGDAMLTVTHRPAENSRDVISYAAGYNFKPMSEVTFQLGKNSFDLFTAQDTAWSRDAATDHKIAAALQTAPSITITGVPMRKTTRLTTDKFALKGAAEAYAVIGKACGIETARPAVKTAPKPAKKAPRKR